MTFLPLFAAFVAASTALLIFAGGLVTSTGSGLSVPDWPTTYGWFMLTFPLDKMVGGIFYEHTHRLIASGVGLLIVVLALWLWKADPRRWVRRLGYIALAAVITQGILGGITVLWFLPDAISIAHAGLAQLVFCLTVSIALFTSPGWLCGYAAGRQGPPYDPGFTPPEAYVGRGFTPRQADLRAGSLPRPLARWGAKGPPCGPEQEDPSRTAAGDRTLQTVAALTTAAIYAQIIVGATMRHTGAGLAIPDFPLAFGQIVPPFWSAPIAIHYAHRVGALLVSALGLATVGHVLYHHIGRPELRRPSLLLLALLALQITLGAMTVLSGKHYLINSLHVVTGAMVLGTSLVLGLRAYRPRFAGSTPRNPAYAGPPTRQPRWGAVRGSGAVSDMSRAGAAERTHQSAVCRAGAAQRTRRNGARA